MIKGMDAKEYMKIYYRENKDKYSKKTGGMVKGMTRAEYDKKYKADNYQNFKVICECGCKVHRHYINKHMKTKKHIKLVEAKAAENDSEDICFMLRRLKI